ncbi:putative 2-aminoethylphosphonate ABC transporter ATP-binding protein [Cupriavidus necator]|uniref:putative 2-aminoethylphosphonate ABC transporter ATP-binding protein n=1 Tax=Cupriavidus necator TaxID=106590 RepID=UPI00148FE49F|nr:putative 2-aminoethylphosphonate ABC transporter ATP-binding protein [Cupriavidus necator]NOV27065.1 putative 2-aminoethylphosphonate ABC transporter ATP-binding protein [Cupriavidus necator]
MQAGKPTQGRAFLAVDQVSKRFGGFVALDGVSLSVGQGELLCLLGPSGCGKTTLLRIIAGLEREDAGRIHAGARALTGLPPQARDYGILFQSYALFPNLTVAQNVAYGLHGRGMGRTHRDARVAEMLGLVGLAGSERKFPGQLSGGQQQRVAMARALAPAPSLLLLDEPMSALDARVREHLRAELRQLQRRLNITTVMVTHDQEEAMTMADRIAVMEGGRIVQAGTPAEIYEQPASAFVAGFVGQANWLPGHSAAGRFLVGEGSEAVELLLDAAAPVAGAGRLCCRPEAVRLDPDPAEPNRLLARVVDQTYLGNRYRLALAADRLPGLTLFADVAREARHRLPEAGGHKFWIALPAPALRVFA